MVLGRRTLVGSVAVGVVAAIATACSTAQPPAQFSIASGQPLTLSPAQLLKVTGGATPVAFGKPAHGTLTYGPAGTMVYTPDAGFSGTDQLQVTTTDAVTLFSVTTPPIAKVGDIEIQGSATGSAIAAVPGHSDQIYGLTDRGPNVDGRTDNEKVLPVPDFNPHIARFQLSDGTATEIQTIGLSGRDGNPMNGLIDPAASTGEVLVGLDGAPLPTSDHGLDTEGLVALADGTFWVSDEYGPYLVHFDNTGKEIERLSPFDGSLPRELAMRSPNQGMEGLTVTPDGTTLVGIMQSALNTPGLAGSAKAVPFTRIVTVDLTTKAAKEYLYPLANPQQSKVAVSEITALSNTTFLVDERDNKQQPDANKKIYVADIAGATDVGPQSTAGIYQADAGGLLVYGKPLETFVGVTDDAAATERLKAVNVVPAGKSLKLDLSALLRALNPQGMFFGHDKIEGLATPNAGGTLVIANDSDFGIGGIESTPPPFTLKPKTLPNGRQDSGEFLVVDTTKLPATTHTATVSIKVG